MTTRKQELIIHSFSSMIDKLPNMNQWRKIFLIEILILFLSIHGQIHFLQLARYEKTDRNYFTFISSFPADTLLLIDPNDALLH